MEKAILVEEPYNMLIVSCLLFMINCKMFQLFRNEVHPKLHKVAEIDSQTLFLDYFFANV
jgi:hypothetical protein